MAHHLGEAVERLRRATVAIRGAAGTRAASGSGVVWRPDGRIVTNAHVVAAMGGGAAPIEVEFWDGRRAAARVLERSGRADLASIGLTDAVAGIEAAMIGRAAELRPGEVVVAVGNPLGFTGAASSGVVHSAGGGGAAVLGQPWVVSQVRLAPGNSGGPLANARGEVVGINTMIYNGLAMSVASEMVELFLAGEAAQKRRGGALGVNVRAVRWNGRGGVGFLVMEIERGSAAEAASLLAGDVLVGAGGRAFDTLADLHAAIGGAGAGALTIDFVRGAERARVRSVVVRLAGEGQQAAA